jgi:PAS domain S-box-containing protein
MSPPLRLVSDPSRDLLEAVRGYVESVQASTEGDDDARERQIRFHALMAELATGFLGLDADELDTAIGGVLERIAEFAGAERAAFVRVEVPDDILHVTHEWNSPAAVAAGSLRSLHGQRGMRWSLAQLRQGRVLHVRSREEIDPDARQERTVWDLFGLQSILALPVTSLEGELLGFAAFATLTHRAAWRDEELPLFDLATAMLRNVFEQQKQLAELERSELRLRRLLESGAIGILAADTDGRIWEANDAALAVVGMTRDDLDAGLVRWNELTPAEYRPMTGNALEQLENSGSAEPWEQDIYRPDGSRVSILVSLARLPESRAGILIYAVDITADRKARNALALRDRLARLVTLFSTRLIAVAPTRVGEVLGEALREVGGVLGLDRCTVWIDIEGQSPLSRCEHVWDRGARAGQRLAIPPVDRTALPSWDSDFRNHRPMVVRDVEAELAQGSPERGFLSMLGVRSGVGVPLVGSEGAIGFATFTSERVLEWPEPVVSLLRVLGEIFAAAIARSRSEARQRAVHQDLQRTITERTIQLESANRELEAFSYAVSHDLRAPLRSIDGFSRILVEDHTEGLPPDPRSILERIRATSQRMGELIDALLKLSRIARLEPQFRAIDLSALVREQASALSSSDPDRRVEFRIADGVVVRAEPRLIAALVDNLLRNAWKFTATRPVAHIEFGVERGREGPVYFVRDDGVGFEPSQAERLFAPFQRLHDPREYEGHGIGLATVKRIVVLHGGRAWASGETGKGAVFRFTLAAEA